MFGLSGRVPRREVSDVGLEVEVSVESWKPVEPVVVA